MIFDMDKLTLTNIKEFNNEVHAFYKSFDKEKQKYTRRVGIVLYDAIRKNDIDTEEKLEAIKNVIEILNVKREHNKNDLSFADNILRKNGMCWIMGDE